MGRTVRRFFPEGNVLLFVWYLLCVEMVLVTRVAVKQTAIVLCLLPPQSRRKQGNSFTSNHFSLFLHKSLSDNTGLKNISVFMLREGLEGHSLLFIAA